MTARLVRKNNSGVYVLFMHTWQRLMCVRRLPAFNVVGTGFLEREVVGKKSVRLASENVNMEEK